MLGTSGRMGFSELRRVLVAAVPILVGVEAAGQYASENVSLIAQLDLTHFGAESGNDSWGYTSPSGREYALFCHSSGTAFIEITDPAQPVILANLAGPPSFYRDVKVYEDHAYVISDGGGGIQVFDLAGIDAGQVVYRGSVIGPGTPMTHNQSIDEVSGFLYRIRGGTSEGLRIYDIVADPDAPVYVGSYSLQLVHDAQVVTYTSGPHAGRQVAFCLGPGGGGNPDGLTILDVTDKAGIFALGGCGWPGLSRPHQGWLGPDRSYLYVNDEGSAHASVTYVIDVSDLGSPFLAGSFTNGNTARCHNLFVHGYRVFEANYASGLRVWDIALDPVHATEVAWFDTYPEDDSNQFKGLFSSYPYFASGVILGSDISRGLFLLRVEVPPGVYCTSKVNSQGCSPTIGSSGVPSVTDPGPFEVSCSQVVPGKSGLFFYGYRPAGLAFQGGFLCVEPPVRRTSLQSSGGAAACSGSFLVDVNGIIQSGLDPGLVLGAEVFGQYWSRDPLDPTGFGTSLSDGLRFAIGP